MGRRTRRNGLPDAWLGEWIGRWTGDVEPAVVRLRLDAGPDSSEHPITGTLDLPGGLRFGMPVSGWWRTSADVVADRLTMDLGGEPGVAWLEVDPPGTVLVVRLTRSERGSTIRLRRTVPLDFQALRPWIGEYAEYASSGRLEDPEGLGRSGHTGHTGHTGRAALVLGAFPDDDLGQPYAYYAETAHPAGESPRVVRLYPLGPDRFLSERGESLVVKDFERSSGRYIGFRAAGSSRAVELRRTDEIVEEPVRFALDAEGTTRIAGTLLLPNRAGGTAGAGAAYPAVVMVHGAAGGSRDFYRMFAHPLVRRGVAVLLYDKAGHGDSTGPEPTIFDQAAAVDAAVAMLRARPDVDDTAVGIWGVSNGMWAAPMVAARHPEVAFLAGAGAPGVSMARSEAYRRIRALADAGISRGAIERVGRAWELIFATATAGRADEAAATELDELLGKIGADPELEAYPVPEYARVEPMLSPVPPAMPARDLIARLTGAPDTELGYDPVASYAEIRCPVLLQYGEDDLNVPVGESVHRIGDALRAAGNVDVTIRVVPGVGHLLDAVPERVDGLAYDEVEYLLHGFRFAPGVLDELATWIADRAYGRVAVHTA